MRGPASVAFTISVGPMHDQSRRKRITFLLTFGLIALAAALLAISWCQQGREAVPRSLPSTTEDKPETAENVIVAPAPSASPEDLDSTAASADSGTPDSAFLSWDREPTSEDYDVWNAVLSTFSGMGTVHVWHLVEPTSVFDRGQTESALRRFPEARPTAEAWARPAAELDIEKFRWASKRALHRHPFRSPVELLDAAQLAQLAGGNPRPPWLVSPLLIPNSEAIIVRLSWPAYRGDKRAAYLICAVCTRWWGSVITYRVDKDFLSEKWKAGQSSRRTFTNWKAGKLFIDE